MNRTASIALITWGLGLSACAAQPVQVVPGPARPPTLLSARVVLNLKGEGDAQTFVGIDPLTGEPRPFSALVKWKGNGRATGVLDSLGATLYLEGDSTFEVVPVAGQEAAAQRAVDQRRIVIMRDGVMTGLNAPVELPAPTPPAPPPPAPLKPNDPQPCPPIAACVGGACEVPFAH